MARIARDSGKLRPLPASSSPSCRSSRRTTRASASSSRAERPASSSMPSDRRPRKPIRARRRVRRTRRDVSTAEAPAGRGESPDDSYEDVGDGDLEPEPEPDEQPLELSRRSRHPPGDSVDGDVVVESSIEVVEEVGEPVSMRDAASRSRASSRRGVVPARRGSTPRPSRRSASGSRSSPRSHRRCTRPCATCCSRRARRARPWR